MKVRPHIKNISELFPHPNLMREKINSLVFRKEDIERLFSSPIYLNASITLLILSGKASIHVNYKIYTLKNQSVALLSVLHLFQISDCSDDFECMCLFVSKDFMEEMDPTEFIYVRTKYGVKLYNTPVLELQEDTLRLLKERMGNVDRAIDDTSHYFYKQMILSSVIAFFLDLSNIIEHHRSESRDENSLTRYESITKQFIELLVDNYRKEHNVDFYSSRLNITSHYLTLIVKQITGQSVSDFIFEMLYSDARALLTQSKLSIQEIAATLHFSDQSSFGKFFKRRAGVSPFDFRSR